MIEIAARYLVVAAVVSLGIFGSQVRVYPQELAGNPGYRSCWNFPSTIRTEQGIAADDVQAYFVDGDGKIVAVDLVTGAVAWTAELGGEVRSELVLADSKIMTIAQPTSGVTGGRLILRAHSPRTGLAEWNIELPNADKYYLAADAGNLAVFSSRGEMWMLEPSSGRVRWNRSLGGNVASAPTIDAGRILVVADGKRLVEFSVSDGEQVASAEIDGQPVFVGLGKDSSAVYSDVRGTVHSIRMGGGRVWKFRAGGRIVYAKPIGENVVLGSADNFIYFMSVDYGNLRWKRRLSGRVASGELIGKDLAIFTVVGDQSAYVVELNKGRVIDRLEIDADDAFLLTPIRANGRYVIAASAKGLSAFSTVCQTEKSGKQLPLSKQ